MPGPGRSEDGMTDVSLGGGALKSRYEPMRPGAAQQQESSRGIDEIQPAEHPPAFIDDWHEAPVRMP